VSYTTNSHPVTNGTSSRLIPTDFSSKLFKNSKIEGLIKMEGKELKSIPRASSPSGGDDKKDGNEGTIVLAPFLLSN